MRLFQMKTIKKTYLISNYFMKTPHIYHFTPKELWESGKASNNYLPEGFDEEGFIHCSSYSQILRSANKHADKTKEIILLKIDPKALTSKLVYENTSGGTEPFPHIYGHLNNEAVIAEYAFSLGLDGTFQLPF